MLAALVIVLREGVEASMIVAVLLAFLKATGRREHFRDVFLGVGAALVLAAAGGVVVYRAVSSYDGSRERTLLQAITYLVAVVTLTCMTFWMQTHARTMSADLRERADSALGRGARAGLVLLAFQAVGREGLETVAFTLAAVFSTSRLSALSGAAIGFVLALAVAFLVYHLGQRLVLARFFGIITALVIVSCASMLANAVQSLQALGWLPFLTAPAWDSAALLPQDGTIGDLLHTFFGYSDSPSKLQVAVYCAYLVVVGVAIGKRVRIRRQSYVARSAMAQPAVENDPGEAAVVAAPARATTALIDKAAPIETLDLLVDFLLVQARAEPSPRRREFIQRLALRYRAQSADQPTASLDRQLRIIALRYARLPGYRPEWTVSRSDDVAGSVLADTTGFHATFPSPVVNQPHVSAEPPAPPEVSAVESAVESATVGDELAQAWNAVLLAAQAYENEYDRLQEQSVYPDIAAGQPPPTRTTLVALRAALERAGLTYDRVATKLGVEPELRHAWRRYLP